jgi:RNA polymerase sigma-70 factor (ECF subfamily)
MIVYFNLLETDADRDVCQKLYEENKQKLFGIANGILHNTADAEDAVQSCFSKIIDNYKKYRYKSYEEMVMLCTTIVKHNAIDIIRERKKVVNFTDGIRLGEGDKVSTPDVLEILVRRYESDLVVQAIMELKGEDRELMYLQYICGMKPREIAKMYNVPSSVIRKKTLRCRNKLANILEDYKHESL